MKQTYPRTLMISWLWLLLPAIMPMNIVSAFATPRLPDPPTLKPMALPVKLAGGLFLFQKSVKPSDKDLCKQLLKQAEQVLRQDALIGMELGRELEAGGVFQSTSYRSTGLHQLVAEFQINGGNSWAQARMYGAQQEDEGDVPRLISLQVANMDASLNGGWSDVPVPMDSVEKESTSQQQQ